MRSVTTYDKGTPDGRLREALNRHDTKTLAQAKADLQNRLGAPDLVCPCCGQKALVQPRRISVPMAQQLSRLYRATGHRLPSEHLQEGFTGGDRMMYSMLKHWGLARPVSGSGNPWQLTEKGADFVRGTVSVPRVAYTFNKRVRSYSEEHVRFMDVLNPAKIMED